MKHRTKTRKKTHKTNLQKVKILDLELLNSCKDIQIENLKFQIEMANARSQKLMSAAHIMKNEFLKEKTRLIEKYEAEVKSRDKDSRLQKLTKILKYLENQLSVLFLDNTLL